VRFRVAIFDDDLMQIAHSGNALCSRLCMSANRDQPRSTSHTAHAAENRQMGDKTP